MITQKLLQVFFKALDVAEDVRAVVHRLRGTPQAPPPWEQPWPPTPVTPAPAGQSSPPAPKVSKSAPARRKATGPKAGPRPAGAKASVAPDFQGLLDAISGGKVARLDEGMAVDGRNLLARLVWAMSQGEKLLGRGLTGPEVAQAVSQAGLATAHNNVMRAVRQDAGRLFAKEAGPKRAVRLRLTSEGQAQARALGF